MARVLILGAGVMGTAFAMPLGDCGHDVRLVGTPLDELIVESIKGSGVHPRLRTAVHERVVAFRHHELPEALATGPDLIVIGVSSPGIGWALDQLDGRHDGRVPILLLTKGCETHDGSLRIFPLAVEKRLDVACGGIAGPCIAQELAVRRHSGVVCTFRDPALIRFVANLLDAPYYHARPSTDLIGVEVCAATKNFFTLGIAAGYGPSEALNGASSHNHTANLFSQAILEMAHINEVMGGQPQAVLGMPGAGDLYVTVQGGRNARVGRLLGTGLRYSEALERMPGETIEGAELARAIGPTMLAMMDTGALDPARLPLARAIIAAICNDTPLELPWTAMHRQADIYREVA